MTQTLHRRTPTPAPERGSPFQGHSRLAEIVYGAWAVTPETLREVQDVYEAHTRGPKIDIPAVEARLGRPLANEQRTYEVRSGVAVLPIDGVMAPKANLFMQISGGASTQMLAQSIADAVQDPGVVSILLQIDSPGGSVLGTPELGQAIRDAATQKPVVAVSDGVMASAAYWAGCAANALFVTGPTVMVGSIGVVSTHVDNSAADAAAGVKRTEVVAGKFKRISSDTSALSKEGKAAMQDQVDYLYSLFVDVVAANRGTSVDAVLEHMADGRVFIGQQAIDAGLVDGVSTVDALVAQMASNPQAFATRRPAQIKGIAGKQSSSAGAARADISPSSTTTERPLMSENQGAAAAAPVITADSIQREHPQIFAAIHAAGAAAERDRVASVRAQVLPGHEALIESFVADGKTTGAEAAMAVLAAERGLTKAAAAAHFADAPQAAKTAAAATDTPKTKAQRAADAKAYAAEKGISFLEAVKALGNT